MLGFILLPFYFYFYDIYSLMDIAVATFVVILVTLGVICFSRGLVCGIAGPVQAIENSKTVVQTIMAAIFLAQIPNLMQFLGLASGLLGVTVIVI